MDLSGPIGGVISSVIVASVGTWWFAYVLKGLRNLSTSARLIVFASIWMAYFVLMMVLVDKVSAG